MLLSTYSYYKILATLPVLCSTSLSPSYDQQFGPLKPPPSHGPSPQLVTTHLFCIRETASFFFFLKFTSLLFFRFHIYVKSCSICLSLTYFSYCNTLQVCK